MTVQSLWQILDEAGCCTKVGAKTLFEQPTKPKQWPLQSRVLSKPFQKSLAVDLSIWICESLTSQALGDGHAKPWLHLAFSRTTKLLSLGIKLVVVIEGKRRINSSDEADDTFRKRRSGTLFWKACNECEEMLKHLGVEVVRAKAEGEALCALLSKRGIVDGVISNDGDCFLFGAQTLYTKFSIENLEKGEVQRYSAANLRAPVQPNDSSDLSLITLSNSDLVAFALLTGSDLVGPGFPNVGPKRALRYIRKCHVLYPDKTDAAIHDILSWPTDTVEDVPNEESSRKCSCCAHSGTKRDHLKNGCVGCGTAAGEPCTLEDADDKLRISLQTKTRTMDSFNPQRVVDAYGEPNENQLPLALINGKVAVRMPDLGTLMEMKMIVKGHNLRESREYLTRIAGRIMALIEFNIDEESDAQDSLCLLAARNRPFPTLITRALIQNDMPSYEVTWKVPASATDEYGEEVDGYEYVSIHPQATVQSKYPNLVLAFEQAEKERKKQGNAEETRRKAFIESMKQARTEDCADRIKLNNGKRREFFDVVQKSRKPLVKGKIKSRGEDARRLAFMAKKRKISVRPARRQDAVTDNEAEKENQEAEVKDSLTIQMSRTPLKSNNNNIGHRVHRASCEIGGVEVPISPLKFKKGPRVTLP